MDLQALKRSLSSKCTSVRQLPTDTERRALSLGLCRGAVTGTELDVVAELVIQLRLAALRTHRVVCDALWSAVSCPGTLLP